MALWGVRIEAENGTDFFAVNAENEGEAEKLVRENLFNVGTAAFEVYTLETLLIEQYDSVALMGTV